MYGLVDASEPPQSSWGFAKANVALPLASVKENDRKKRKRVLTTLYDVGGEKGIRGIWGNYYSEAHACVFTIDSTDHARLPESAAALKEVFSDPRMAGKPLLILATKGDAPNALSASDVYDKLALNDLIKHGEIVTGPEKAGWWVEIVSCRTNDTSIGGEAFADEIKLTRLLTATHGRLSTLDSRRKKDIAAQQKQWQKEKRERKERVDSYKKEEKQQPKDGGDGGTDAGAGSKVAQTAHMVGEMVKTEIPVDKGKGSLRKVHPAPEAQNDDSARRDSKDLKKSLASLRGKSSKGNVVYPDPHDNKQDPSASAPPQHDAKHISNADIHSEDSPAKQNHSHHSLHEVPTEAPPPVPEKEDHPDVPVSVLATVVDTTPGDAMGPLGRPRVLAPLGGATTEALRR
ncbi:ADP-ribosylation factor-like protein 13B [Gaertneriomyces sp. JEL0708]|nr:ADP-ribosylation factor-like protein 13B [Gaertneriomyces sp. JEL0708]